MLQKKIEDTYSEFIGKRTYTRWIESENRREAWVESVQRYSDFFESRVPEKLLPLYKEAIQLKKNKQVMGSMRALWSAGPALAENNFAGYNCLSGDTKILTKEFGVVDIHTIAGKSVHLLTSEREWVLSEIKNFGKKKLHTIDFRLNTNSKKEILSTLSH
jgi:hypothetical protein